MRERTAPRVDVALALVSRGGRFLVTHRADHEHLGGLWEFPGGKVRRDEAPSEAALRELAEEAGLRGGRPERLMVLEHDYDDRSVRLHCFLVHEYGGEPASEKGKTWAWLGLEELSRLEMPAANGSILEALMRRAGGAF